MRRITTIENVRGAGLVTRLGSGPIVAAGSIPGYEAVFNAGLVLHDDVFHLFARAVHIGYGPDPSGATRFLDYVSDIVVFTSSDGEHYTFSHVLLPAPEDGSVCYEDARVSRIRGDRGDAFVMSYTVLPLPPRSQAPHYIGAVRLDYVRGRFVVSGDPDRRLGPEGIANKDGVVFSLRGERVGLLQRIGRDIQVSTHDDLSSLWDADEAYWAWYLDHLDEHVVLRPGDGVLGIGAGAPPIDTPDGLLLFYHERLATGSYVMCVALLDPATGTLRSRLASPVLTPTTPWELVGDVDDVIFVQGAQYVPGGIYLTYGAADRCVGAALANTTAILRALEVAGPNTSGAR